MSSTPYLWRAFIGPAYEPSESAAHYQWPDLWDFDVDVSAAHTTLAATLNDGATTATLTAGSALLGSGGGCWIGPNGSGQGWEYISYAGISSNTMNSLIREPSIVREHNGSHAAGAAVAQWWEITGTDGRLHFTEQIDSTLSAITWTAQLAGIRAAKPAMRSRHLIVIQTRPALGTWSNTLVGFCRQPKIHDTYERLREWSLDIICAAQIIEGYRTKSIRVGAMNLAESGGANTDTTLVEASKERMSGDFISSAPNLSGQSAIDGDPDTLWIAERMRGDRNLDLPTDVGVPLHHGGFVTGARLWRLPGEPKGHRYLEFVAGAAGELRTWPNMWLASKTPANAVLVPFEGLSTAVGDLIILAENQAVFEANNPLSEAIATIEIGSGFFDGLDLAGDAVAIVKPNPYGWMPTVAWGTGGTPEAGEDYGTGGTWDTDTIAAPTIGKVIRYQYYGEFTSPDGLFFVDTNDAPGYRSNGEDPWIQVALPVLGLALRDDITSSGPGAGQPLYLTKGGSDGTEGLKTTGTIQIGLEQISYSARLSDSVTVSARGANSTSAIGHAQGDLIRVVDTDGIATQGQLISEIGWSRPDGLPYPAAFTIRTSNLDSARVPPDDNHTEDYTTHAIVSDHAASTYSYTLSPAKRVTHLILEIDHMSASPCRPRVNGIDAIADAAMFDPTLILAATEAENVIGRVLSNTGFPAGSVVITEGEMTLDELVTAEDDSAWSVAVDIASKCSVLLDCDRGGWVSISPNSLPAGVLSAATTWTDVTASACEFVQSADMPIAQVKLPYRLPDGSSGETRYPATPSTPAGRVMTLSENRYPDDATAYSAAKRAYILARYPLTMIVECAEEQPSLRPGAVARVQWSFADDTPEMDRVVIVTATDHEIAKGIWTTVLTCQQVDREWPA